jgi:Holin of 3TMs, for gene-transfer release
MPDLTGLGSVFDFAGKIFDRVLPNQAERDAAKLELFKAQQAGQLQELAQEFELKKAQIGINLEEAKSSDPFVSRGRPFVIWVCGFALAYSVLIEPIMRFVATVVFHYTGTFPVIDTTLTMQLLVALLGLSGYRSFEKFKGVATK